jgi:catechol 2,3-dioxygenase-like lactoylglutathione lyase family enzyme
MDDAPIGPGAAAARDYGLAATGQPVHAATLGVAELARSSALYRDQMGLEVLEQRRLAGRGFEVHWGLPAGASATVAVLGEPRFAVGRLVLVEFDAPGRQVVREVEGQSVFGLVNLNFYSDDIFAHTRRLEAAGCRAWSEPQVHDMGAMGQPVEVMLDGPDGVVINLIELRGEPGARVLRTRAWIDDHGGFNRCGSTPMSTTAHHVKAYQPARGFYEQVLGMSVRNDLVLGGEAMERFTRFPPGARARDTYLQGNHVYGKIALMHPLNFECLDLVPRAVAPHIGYLAQTFLVDDLQAALAAAGALGAETASPALEIDLPVHGRVAAAMLRNPGSGALQELLQQL